MFKLISTSPKPMVVLAGIVFTFFALSGCDNVNRSLLFYTNTNFGLEVGIDPTQSSGKILIGYKRAEGVVNPVYIPPCPAGTCGGCKACQAGGLLADRPNHFYRSEAYSVLAKLKGKATASGGAANQGEVSGGGEVAQWFATGKAAVILANNDYAPAALMGSSETAKAIAESGKLGSKLEPGGFDSGVIATLDKAFDDLSIVIAQDANGKAAQVAKQLNHEIASELFGLGTVSFYKLNGTTAQKTGTWTFDPGGDPAFKQWLFLQSNLNNAVTVLENVLVKPDISFDTKENFIYSCPEGKVVINTTMRDSVKAALTEAKAAHASSLHAVNKNPGMVNSIKDVLRVWIELYTGDKS